jgi:hypothetical protein
VRIELRKKNSSALIHNFIVLRQRGRKRHWSIYASTLSEVTRANPLGREHKAGTASLSIESFELSRLRDGSTLVVWILNEVLVLKIQYREAS